MTKSGGSDSKNTLYCAFCGKSQHEVRKLIAGPTVFICDECVEFCMAIIDVEHETTLVNSQDGLSGPRDICEVPDDYVIGQDHAKRVLPVVGLTGTAAAERITEFPTSIGANSIVAGSDGALWFIGGGANDIGRITTAGVVTEFSIPVPAGVIVYTNIAAGPDGALWCGLAKDTGNRRAPFASRGIGRMTTTGEFSEFLLPQGDPISGIPNGITAGPDGALWFTEEIANKIGRMTTTGEFSEFSLPPGDPMRGLYYGMTAGPDGAVWFSETHRNKIARITAAGAVSEFPLPTPNSRPWIITAGPDGALWFTAGGANNIGRITTAGTISEFALPTPNSGPEGITAGHDGALWFTECSGNKIGRITTAGTISEFPLPTPNSGSWGGGPCGITAGPDGALWFTGRYQRAVQRKCRIGRFGDIDEDVTADMQTFHWER
jgi:streptogramin lyase